MEQIQLAEYEIIFGIIASLGVIVTIFVIIRMFIKTLDDQHLIFDRENDGNVITSTENTGKQINVAENTMKQARFHKVAIFVGMITTTILIVIGINETGLKGRWFWFVITKSILLGFVVFLGVKLIQWVFNLVVKLIKWFFSGFATDEKKEV